MMPFTEDEADIIQDNLLALTKAAKPRTPSPKDGWHQAKEIAEFESESTGVRVTTEAMRYRLKAAVEDGTVEEKKVGSRVWYRVKRNNENNKTDAD